MRAGINFEVTREDRLRLDRIVRDRNSPQKHATRAEVTLATADGSGTMEVMRRSGLSKPAASVCCTVQRVWMAHGLAPHRVRMFKLSKDKRFVEKFADVVGLHIDQPHAIAFSVDEKSQIQALDRTQPDLPMKMKKGLAGAMIHARQASIEARRLPPDHGPSRRHQSFPRRTRRKAKIRRRDSLSRLRPCRYRTKEASVRAVPFA